MAGCRYADGKPCPHDHLPHGTWNRYANHGCRCDLCREAARESRRGRSNSRCRDSGVPCTHDLTHGTLGAYSNHGCRCTVCRVYWSNYVGGMRARRILRVKRILREGGVDPRPHGTYSGYEAWGCRCRPCRLANNRRSQRRSAKRRASKLGQDRE